RFRDRPSSGGKALYSAYETMVQGDFRLFAVGHFLQILRGLTDAFRRKIPTKVHPPGLAGLGTVKRVCKPAVTLPRWDCRVGAGVQGDIRRDSHGARGKYGEAALGNLC